MTDIQAEMRQQLMNALYHDDFQTVETLLDKGVDVNQPYNASGWTPFMWACKNLHEPELIESFVKAGGDVNSRNNNGETPFMIAAVKRSSPDTLEVLLKVGADIDAQDKLGNTSFINLVRHPQVMMRLQVVDFMIENDANPNIQNHKGKAVWDYASEQEGLTEYICTKMLEECDAE